MITLYDEKFEAFIHIYSQTDSTEPA